MKKFLSIFAIAAVALFAVSCDDAGGSEGNGNPPASTDGALVESLSFEDTVLVFEYNSNNYPSSIKLYDGDDGYNFDDIDEADLEGTFTFVYGNGDVLVKMEGYEYIKAYFNSDGYVSKIILYEENGDESDVYYTFSYDSNGYLSKMVGYGHEYGEPITSTTKVFGWEDENLTSIFNTEVYESSSTQYSMDVLEYNNTAVIDSNCNICTMLCVFEDSMFFMPTSWFGKASKNEAIVVKSSEPSTDINESNWVYEEDNTHDVSYEYDGDGKITKCTSYNSFASLVFEYTYVD